MENATRPTHPLILVAAASLALAGLAATAHFTGLIPSRSAEAPPAAVAVAPPPAAAAQAPAAAKPETPPVAKAETPAPASKPHPRQHRQSSEPARPAVYSPPDKEWHYDGGNRRVSTGDNGIDVIPARPAPVYSAPAPCRDCGTVESVREIAAPSQGSGLGAIAGGVLGGVLGHQVGRGQGKDLATIAGAVGGAVAGHQVEKNMRTEKQYEVAVRFDDGSLRNYPLDNPAWRSGDRVRLDNGRLVALRGGER